jgi:uncharacterized membrane protein (DUF2068 family)
VKEASTSDAARAKRRAPTLYAIILIKLGKGLLLLSLALGLYTLSDNNLPEEFRHALRALHLDPENRFFAGLVLKVQNLTATNVIWFAGGTGLYSLFSLVEGTGLLFRVTWAGWLAIGESLFFIPIEVYDLTNHLSIAVLVILALNVMIVWYLLQNRHRLFRHHFPHSPAPSNPIGVGSAPR